MAHHDECTFFDKKESIEMASESSQGKLLKHICALSNSNPNCKSFIIFGVSNHNDLIGVSFIDDADIQNIASSLLDNPPKIKYENISFPDIPKDKSIGILTIEAEPKTTAFKKNIWKIPKGTTYQRVGSKSEPCQGKPNIYSNNQSSVDSIIKYSSNSIKGLLDGVFEFYKMWGNAYSPQYLVFKDQYVLCWSGYRCNDFYSEVDIQIINEGTRIFFSATKEVKIFITDSQFRVDQYQHLGFDDKYDFYPFESTILSFEENGSYSIEKETIFEAPIFSKEEIDSLYKRSKEFERKYKADENITSKDLEFGEGLANYFFICYLNGIDKAKDDFYNSKEYLDGVAALWYRECHEILEKI